MQCGAPGVDRRLRRSAPGRRARRSAASRPRARAACAVCGRRPRQRRTEALDARALTSTKTIDVAVAGDDVDLAAGQAARCGRSRRSRNLRGVEPQRLHPRDRSVPCRFTMRAQARQDLNRRPGPAKNPAGGGRTGRARPGRRCAVGSHTLCVGKAVLRINGGRVRRAGRRGGPWRRSMPRAPSRTSRRP